MKSQTKNNLERARIREQLAKNEMLRMRAVAEFPLRVHNLAVDMKRLVDISDALGPCDSLREAIRYLAERMNETFVDTFGCDIPLPEAMTQERPEAGF